MVDFPADDTDGRNPTRPGIYKPLQMMGKKLPTTTVARRESNFFLSGWWLNHPSEKYSSNWVHLPQF